MPWRRAAGLGLAAILFAIWSLYVRRRAIEAGRAAERNREPDNVRAKSTAA
jgi:hypothetical protein